MTNKTSSEDKWNILFDTLDEITLLLFLFLTCGMILFVGRKRNTDKSIIHGFFKYFDYFETIP